MASARARDAARRRGEPQAGQRAGARLGLARGSRGRSAASGASRSVRNAAGESSRARLHDVSGFEPAARRRRPRSSSSSLREVIDQAGEEAGARAAARGCVVGARPVDVEEAVSRSGSAARKPERRDGERFRLVAIGPWLRARIGFGFAFRQQVSAKLIVRTGRRGAATNARKPRSRRAGRRR